MRYDIEETQVHTYVNPETHPHLATVVKAWAVHVRGNDGSSALVVVLMDYYEFDNYDQLRHLRIKTDSGVVDGSNRQLLQYIKNRVLGLDAVAVEVFPVEADDLDGDDTYHLWELGEDARAQIPNLLELYPCPKKPEEG